MSVSIFDMGKHAEAVAQERAIETGAGNQSKLFNPMPAKVGDTMSMIVRIMPVVKRALNAEGKQLVDDAGNKQYIISDKFSDNIISKFFYLIEHDNQRIWFDSPVNDNKWCPMVNVWSTLRNSTDPNVQNFSNEFKRKQSTTCYIQIINAPQFPDLTGKIVPFAVPFELMKFMDQMLNPSEDDRKLGVVPVLPYDLMSAPLLKLSYVAETVQGIKQPVRKWTVSAQPANNGRNEAYFAAGQDPKNPWVYATEMGEQAVLEHICSQETEDIATVYGHHEPSIDTIYQLYLYLRDKLAWIPGMVDKISNWLYFKWCSDRYNAENGGQPAAQAVTGAQAPAVPQAPAAPENPAPAAPENPAPENPAPAAHQAPQVPVPGQAGIDELPA